MCLIYFFELDSNNITYNLEEYSLYLYFWGVKVSSVKRIQADVIWMKSYRHSAKR